jgi:hypothetical protein
MDAFIRGWDYQLVQKRNRSIMASKKKKSARRSGRPKSAHARRQALLRTARSIVLQCPDPARLLEFHYWSRQKGLADFIRASFALSRATRTALQNFVTATSDPRGVAVLAEKRGRLTLLMAEPGLRATATKKRC